MPDAAGSALSGSSPDGSPAEAPQSILSHLVDAANLLTLCGLASSLVAMLLAQRGEYAGAAIALVAAFVFDVVDGPVAARAKGRDRDQSAFGANLDSLADMVSAGVALGVVVLAYGHLQVAYLPVAIAIGAAAALRLSYFNVHGLDPDSGSYTGLPTDLAILGFVALMLLDGPLDLEAFRIVLSAGTVALAALMVSPLQIPKLTGRSYLAVIAIGLALAALHATRLGG
ncbi:MAG: CDP-alcohol phosphatidyltransferase family protein [Acidimicrobiia bacterium]|nr:CDP-alcohol phosphatidyltransferase family protein [Acidimicrobiia bacterium]